MGWIYNGTEFIKANKAQLKAYDKHNNFLLGKAALEEPFALPTLAATVGILAGTITIGSFAAVLWGPAKELVDEGIKAIGDLPGEIKAVVIKSVEDAGISSAETPKFISDATACLKTHPSHVTVLGQKVPDLLRAPKLIVCMTRKGWADDIAIQGLKNLF